MSDREFFDFLRRDESVAEVEDRHVLEAGRRYLTEQGYDVDEALEAVEIGRRRRAEQTKARARHIEDLARTLRKAKRAADVAGILWRLSRSPADLDEVTVAMAAERRAYDALREACYFDDALVSQVRRRAAR